MVDRAVPLWWLLLSLLAGAGVLLGTAVGSQGWEPAAWTSADPALQQIVWDIRAPRAVGAWLGGALLGLAGAMAQGLFRNPLADPYLLGSASGASLGVSVYLSLSLALLGGSTMATGWLARLGMTGAAFLGALLALVLTLALARGVQQTLRLLLAGVVVGVVLGALASLVAVLQPPVFQAMQGFTLGATAWLGWTSCALMAAALLLCLLVGLALARVLDALTLGEATAHSLGMPLRWARLLLVAALSLATAVAVAQMGLIAFVGLAAPHVVRSVIRCTHVGTLLLSAWMGGALLLFADVLARALLAPQDLPVGVLTAVLGGGYLLWRMKTTSAGQA